MKNTVFLFFSILFVSFAYFQPVYGQESKAAESSLTPNSFFLHFHAGASQSDLSIEPDDGDKVDYTGSGTSLNLQGGWAFTRNIAIHGGLLISLYPVTRQIGFLTRRTLTSLSVTLNSLMNNLFIPWASVTILLQMLISLRKFVSGAMRPRKLVIGHFILATSLLLIVFKIITLPLLIPPSQALALALVKSGSCLLNLP